MDKNLIFPRNYSPVPERAAGGRGSRGYSPPPTQSSRYSRTEPTQSRYSNSSPPPPSKSRYQNSSPHSNSRQPLRPSASGYHHSISPSPTHSPVPQYYGGRRRSPSPLPQQHVTSYHRDRDSFHRWAFSLELHSQKNTTTKKSKQKWFEFYIKKLRIKVNNLFMVGPLVFLNIFC